MSDGTSVATDPPGVEPEPFPLDPVFGRPSPMPDLPPGATIEIVKLDPGGAEVVRYPGVVLAVEDGWVVTEAWWTNRTVLVGDLPFRTGDRLIESFSPSRPFNCFAVHDPADGRLRGWYANVTHPVRFDLGHSPPRVIWHDLFLDVVATVEGEPVLLDADELAASGLAGADPALHAAIVRTGEVVRELMTARRPPFGASGWPTGHDSHRAPSG